MRIIINLPDETIKDLEVKAKEKYMSRKRYIEMLCIEDVKVRKNKTEK